MSERTQRDEVDVLDDIDTTLRRLVVALRLPDSEKDNGVEVEGASVTEVLCRGTIALHEIVAELKAINRTLISIDTALGRRK